MSSSNKKMFVRLAVAAAVAIPTIWLLVSQWNTNDERSKTSPSLSTKSSTSSIPTETRDAVITKQGQDLRVTILYATCTGTARKFAKRLADKLEVLSVTIDIVDVKDFDEFLLEKGGIFLFLISTYTEGKVPETAVRFFDWLIEQAHDFRVERNYLAKVKFGVFGLGAKIYKKHFCTPARDANNAFIDLGAGQLVPSLFGDDASNLEDKFTSWSDLVVKAITLSKQPRASNGGGDVDLANTAPVIAQPKKLFKPNRAGAPPVRKSIPAPASAAAGSSAKAASGQATCDADNGGGPGSGCCQNSSSAGASESVEDSMCCGSGKRETVPPELEPPSDEEEDEDRINNEFVTMDMDSDSDGEAEDLDQAAATSSDVGGCGSGDVDGTDLEDLGRNISGDIAPTGNEEDGLKREMVTKLQRKALVKEGYRIIGSHSAVKLCRWTKNQMRGRGGCYKHSFYGITSYQCMEATPSLACANKCVFCWRHHKNPVGTEWRWKTDSPAMIVDQAVSLHQGMINEMKGVPGVLPERLVEANRVKHCALSLVGEPIMYPRINEMLKELHDRNISTFLVTNAQFPDRMLQLDPVTQLYVSVDAATKDSLKAIDRPLFKNYWDRFLGALKVLKDKKQRTVYRLTLVKDWNMEETEAYAELIEMGQPDFIEIKAMTYCGKSDASSLTMQNVPWHREVCAYSEAIAARLKERGLGPVYSIATEHEHSCCILLAREDKFLVDGVWHTWINYDKYYELVQRYYASQGQITFTSEDYMEPTPTWALYQNEAHGFDPVESRWKRNKAGSLVEVDYKASSSGCG